MYIPQSFLMKNHKDKVDFLKNNSFGILFSVHDGEPYATHIPMIYSADEGGGEFLLGHIARANPQWHDMDGQKVMAVFQGPHAYISPSWYVERDQVPTWNYTAVHVTGKLEILGNKETESLIGSMLSFYGKDADISHHLQEIPFSNMMKAIVGFRIVIEKIEGKKKLSQNKSSETQKKVIDQLTNSGSPMSVELGHIMMENMAGIENTQP